MDVFELDDLKIFRVFAILDLADPNDNVIDMTSNPVAVRNEDGNLLGFATTSWEFSQMKASLFILYSCPERFDIQGGKSVYPLPVFHRKAGPDADYSELIEIKLFSTDTGLPPLSEVSL